MNLFILDGSLNGFAMKQLMVLTEDLFELVKYETCKFLLSGRYTHN